MNKFYKVVTTFSNIGIVIANSFIVEAEEKPQNTSTSNNKCDIYEDYFDNAVEAEAFRQQALREIVKQTQGE